MKKKTRNTLSQWCRNQMNKGIHVDYIIRRLMERWKEKPSMCTKNGMCDFQIALLNYWNKEGYKLYNKARKSK